MSASQPASAAVRFCRADELPEGSVRSRMLGDVAVAVARHEGRVHAFGALCPHQQADLADGILDRGGIACPQHLWRFQLDTGTCKMIPGARIPVYGVEEIGEWILVRLPAGDGAP